MRQHAYTTTGVAIASAVLGALAVVAFLEGAAKALSDLFADEEPVIIDSQRNGGVKAGRHWVAR